MKLIVGIFLLWASTAQAQIFRCDTADGPVFSDSPCGKEAEVVTIEDESSGISGGPSEEVKAYLAKKRQDRAEDREMRANSRPTDAGTAVYPTQAPPVSYPVYWPNNQRPRPDRPPPDRPVARPQPGDGGGNVIRPRKGN